MNNRTLFLLTALLSFLPLLAQRRVVIGTVVAQKDHQPIELATARLITRTDTTRLLGGATTDSLGRFRIVYNGTEPLRLKIGFVGLQSISRNLNFPADKDTLDLGRIELTGSDITMRAAVVSTALARVEQKEDTTVFNAAAFRTPEGSTLEALIKQLPGAEVGSDGTVKVNGKTVKEFLINGKDFFKGDTKIAMKNLPTNLVSKVKTYDKRSDYTEQTGIDDGDESFVLDISTKRELNQSIVSNVDLGGGIDRDNKKLYSTKLMGMRFTDRSRVGFFGSHNNVGDRGFGGPRGFFSNNNGRTTSTMLGTDFSWENGHKKFEAGRLELGGNAMYMRNDNHLETISSGETFLSTTAQRKSFDAANQNNIQLSQSFRSQLRLKWNPDSLTQLSFRPSYEWGYGKTTQRGRSATFDEDPFEKYSVGSVDEVLNHAYATPLTKDTIHTNDDFLKNLNNSYSLGRNHTHKLNGQLHITRILGGRKGQSLSFEARGGYSTTSATTYSRTDIYKRIAADAHGPRMTSAGTHQFSENPTTTWNYRLGLSYVQPIVGKLLGEVRYNYEHKFTDGDRTLRNLYGLDGYLRLSDFLADHTDLGSISELYLPGSQSTIPWLDPLQLLSRLNRSDVQAAVLDAQNSQYATYRYDNHTVHAGLRFNSGKIRLSVGMQISPERTHLKYDRAAIGHIDTVRNIFNCAPNLRLRYNFSKTTMLDLSYRGSSSQPGMTKLLNVVDNSNPLHITMGNPGLRPSWNNQMHLFFNSYSAERLQGAMAHADFSHTTGSISQLMVYDETTGRRFTRPDNIDGNWNASAGFTFNTPLDAAKVLNLSSSTDVNHSRSMSYVSTSTTTAGISDHPTPDEVKALFNSVTAEKSNTKVSSLSERIDLAYRRSWWDATLNGRVSYQHSRSSLISNNNLDTWSFAYGIEGNVTLPWGMSLSTDLRMTSRRGFSASEFNTNELVWNAAISQSFLRNKALTIRFEAYDLLQQESNITRSLTAMARTDSWNNSLTSYVMLHAIYRLNIFGGAKMPERPDGPRRPGDPNGFRPVGPPPGGHHGGPMGGSDHP